MATDINAIDKFTLAHVAIGSMYYALGVSLPAAMAFGVAWEAVERQLFGIGTKESGCNVAIDIAAIGAGWYVASKITGRTDA